MITEINTGWYVPSDSFQQTDQTWATAYPLDSCDTGLYKQGKL